MYDRRYLLVGLLAGLPAARSVPWPGPIQTVQSGCADGVQVPTPTEGPKIELVKRDLAIPPNTCGWVDGQSDDAWVVLVAETCFWYSDRTVVNGFTACIDYGSTCNGDCSYMNTCNVVSPYCGSVYFPSGYRGFGNCNPEPGITYNVELTYTGLNQAVDIPIFTGADGISTGTQYPPGESPTRGTTVVPSAANIASGVSTTTGSVVVQPGGSAVIQPGASSQSAGSSSTPSSGTVITSGSSSSSSHSSTPIGAIVGGVVGGLAVICGTVIAIIWLLRSRKKESRPVPEARFQPGNGGNTGFYPELEQPKPPAVVGRPELADSKPPFYGEKQQVPQVQQFQQFQQDGYPTQVELPAHA